MTAAPDVPRFNVHSTEYQALPAYGGAEAVLYMSPDRRRIAGSFRESGRHEMTLPYDEFMYVIAGTCEITVSDGESFTLGEGDCAYLREGQQVIFDISEGFHDVTVLVSDTPIEY